MPGGFRRKRAREDRRVRVDGNGLRRDVVGEEGLGEDDLVGLATRLDVRADQLGRQRRMGWAVLPAGRAELRRMTQLTQQLGRAFTDVVTIASPELAFATRALATALGTEPGLAPESSRPRLHVVDGPDPDHFAALLQRLDWARTLCIVASTGEADLVTTSHFLLVRDRLLRELGAVAYQQHVVVVTPPGEGALRQIVHDEGFRSLTLPEGVDEHAAVLSVAVLLPLACIGVDVAALSAGGAAMLERCRDAQGVGPAHLLAIALQAASPAGVRVAPPPMQSLRDLASWIERRLTLDATTPDPAIPSHRRVTLLVAEASRSEALAIPKAYQDVESIGCVGGQDLATLAAHEHEADEMARWAAGELTVTLTLPGLSADVLGQVVALTAAATTLARPADAAPSLHEQATRLAYGLVGRTGFEAERAAAERLAARREDRYVA